jgi:hypothetical protein
MLTIVDYSEKAIAVIGTEKGNAEQLQAMKAMKGKWNRGLTCGQGWVFSKRKNGEEVTKWVAMWNAAHPANSAPQTPAPPKPQPAPQPSPEPTPQAVEQPAQAQTIAPAPATISIPIIEDELEGAPF